MFITLFTTARHCPYPMPDKRNPHPPILLFYDLSYYYPSTYTKVFQKVPFLHISPLKHYLCFTSLPLHSTCSSHLTIMNLII